MPLSDKFELYGISLDTDNDFLRFLLLRFRYFSRVDLSFVALD